MAKQISFKDINRLLKKEDHTDSVWTSVKIKNQIFKDIRPVGTKLWFEYHCWESVGSCDAELWLRSHQKVEVLGLADCEVAFSTFYMRCVQGHSFVYQIKFDDGKVFSAFEDELLTFKRQFYRPDPPKQNY